MDDILRNSDGNPNLLNANRNDDSDWLNAYWDNPDNKWNRDYGFAFSLATFFISPLFLERSFAL